MTAATSDRPHRSKQRLPPTAAARAQAAALRTGTATGSDDVVVDLAQYAAAAAGRNTLRTNDLRADGPSRTEGETLTTPKESPHPNITIKENTTP